MTEISVPTNNLSSDPDRRNFYSYSPDVLRLLTAVSDRFFDKFQNQHILEIGPATGWFTHALLESGAGALTLIESNPDFVLELEHKFNQDSRVKIILDDVTRFLSRPVNFDTVVCLGVIYHFGSPIDLIERIVNYVAPHHILLDSPDQPLALVREGRSLGDRRSVLDYRYSDYSITIPIDIQKGILQDFGYTLVDEMSLGVYNINSKEQSLMMLFQKDNL